jgi:hypothetical protein
MLKNFACKYLIKRIDSLTAHNRDTIRKLILSVAWRCFVTRHIRVSRNSRSGSNATGLSELKHIFNVRQAANNPDLCPPRLSPFHVHLNINFTNSFIPFYKEK